MTETYNRKCDTCKHRFIEYDDEASWCACDYGYQTYHTECGKYEEGYADREVEVSRGITPPLTSHDLSSTMVGKVRGNYEITFY